MSDFNDEIVMLMIRLFLCFFLLLPFGLIYAQLSDSIAQQVRSSCQGVADAYLSTSRAADDEEGARSGANRGHRIKKAQAELGDAFGLDYIKRASLKAKSELLETAQDMKSCGDRHRNNAKMYGSQMQSTNYHLAEAAGCDYVRCLNEQLAQMKGIGFQPDGARSGSRQNTSSTQMQSDSSPEATASQDVNQSLALAQQNQSRGEEQTRKDGRKRHNPEYQANPCMSLPSAENPGSFGSLQNNCSYKVNFNFCVLRPKPSSWATAFDCEQQKFGGATAAANGGRGYGHMKGGEAVHFFACREPALVLDTRYNAALGRVEGRCRKIGSD
jgi:hypothetical protein